MPRRPPGAAPKPRGRPRKPFDLLQPRTKRWRRSIDVLVPQDVLAGHAAVDCHPRTANESVKMGRPLMPYDQLSAEGRRTRDYRARFALTAEPTLLVPLLTAAAVVDAEQQSREREAAEAAAEAAAAAESKRLRLEQRLQRELAPDRGYRDEAARLASLVPDLQGECFCMNEDNGPPDCVTPCCRAMIHSMCATKWHAGQNTYVRCTMRGPEWGEEQGADQTYWKRIETVHQCPMCRGPWESARMLKI